MQQINTALTNTNPNKNKKMHIKYNSISIVNNNQKPTSIKESSKKEVSVTLSKKKNSL